MPESYQLRSVYSGVEVRDPFAGGIPMIPRFHIDVGDGDGTHLAEVVIDGAGKRHLGVYRFVLADGTDAVEPDTPTWDCREWQWWAGYDGSTEMRPRMVPAACGGDEVDGMARVWSEYRCDGVRTRHEWAVPTVQEPPRLGYDCTITVTNETGEELAEYGQFFACYTSLNRPAGRWPTRDTAIGCRFWDASGGLVNFLDIGGYHIDRLIVAPDSPFLPLGTSAALPARQRPRRRIMDASGARLAPGSRRRAPRHPVRARDHRRGVHGRRRAGDGLRHLARLAGLRGRQQLHDPRPAPRHVPAGRTRGGRAAGAVG